MQAVCQPRLLVSQAVDLRSKGNADVIGGAAAYGE
jgi:hypothetical protein